MFGDDHDDESWLPDAPLDDVDEEREAAEFAAWAAEFDAARLEDLRAAFEQRQAPGIALMRMLTQFDPADLAADLRVSWLAAWQACQAWSESRLADALISAAGARPTADLIEIASECGDGTVGITEVTIVDANVAELGAALRLAPVTIQRHVDLSRDLAGPWQLLGMALADGRVTLPHVKAVRDHLDRIDRGDGTPEGELGYAEICEQVLSAVIRFAAAHTPGQTAKFCRGLVEQVDVDGLAERRKNARLQASASVMDDVDDQSVFSVRTDTAAAHAMLAAVDSLARDPRFVTRDCERIGQRRAAAALTLILSNVPGGQGVLDFTHPDSPEPFPAGVAADAASAVEAARVTAHVNVVLSLETFLAVSTQPGTVDGVPVAADAVLDLIDASGPRSTLRRLVTDPHTGALLDVGAKAYTISTALRRFITVRDGTCRFPGCARKAERCEVDHATPFDSGGKTTRCNLGPLCKKHHQLKTHHQWRILESRADGSCVWRSPLLKRYEVPAAQVLPPRLTALAPPRVFAATADDDPPF